MSEQNEFRSLTWKESRGTLPSGTVWIMLGSFLAWTVLLYWFGQGSPRPWIQENLLLNAVLMSAGFNTLFYLLISVAGLAFDLICLNCGEKRHKTRLESLTNAYGDDPLPPGRCQTCMHKID